jgi:hypothetical protein
MVFDKINHRLFLVFAILFRIALSDCSWFIYFSLLLCCYQFYLLFVSINDYMPIRFLFGSLMCLQLLLGPSFAYLGLDQYQEGLFKMQIPEDQYFSYVLPGVLLFIIGLNVKAMDLPGEKPDVDRIRLFVRRDPTLPYYLIAIGFASSFLLKYLGSEFTFLFVLIGGLKFIGLYLLVLGGWGIKPFTVAVVYGSIIVSSLLTGMFHDLIIWLIFLSVIYAMKYKPPVLIKLMILVLLAGFVVVIQQLKGDYREATWRRGEEASVQTVARTVEISRQTRQPFSPESFAKSNIRINQGYIITNIMKTVPQTVPHEYGQELFAILEAAFLPRILAPNKLNAGDRDIFMKYTGIQVSSGTSLALSSIGDAYINFSVIGGWVFMFFYGLMYNYFLKAYSRRYDLFPVLVLFLPLIFYYPIRPDCELQTILGHLVKSSFVVFIIISAWRTRFLFKAVPS